MQAEYLIAPLNQKITKALFITDTYFQSYNYNGELDEIVVIGFSGKRMKQDCQPIDIEFKPIKVEAEVSIKFGIE